MLMWYFAQHPLWVYNHGGIALLSAYQAGTMVLVAIALRGSWKRWRIPLVWLWPLVYVAGEYLRMLGLSLER